MGTIEDEIIKLGISVAVMSDVRFPEAIAEAIDPVGVIVMLPAAMAELREFIAAVGTIVLLAKAEVIDAIWADMEANSADNESTSEGIEVIELIDEVLVLEEAETEVADTEERLERAAESEAGLIEVPIVVIIELMAWIWEAKAGLVAVAM